MEAKLLDMNEWEQFGGGGNGWSYYHKTDSSIMLKLNKEEITREQSLTEYSRSKALFEAGINCPEVIDFVTDGKRYGLTMRRIQGKKSFARIIGDDPSRLEQTAKTFAKRSREFHSIKADTTLFQSKEEIIRNSINSSEAIPEDIKRMLLGYLESLDKETFCVHGDFNPGNIIHSEDGRDYWIDLGEFAYGDPDLDIGSLVFLAKMTPAKITEYLFHMTREQFAEFLEIYGREYYGDRWHTPELDEKIRRISMIKAGMSIAKRSRTALIYLPLLKGQKTRWKVILWIVDHLVRKFN